MNDGATENLKTQKKKLPPIFTAAALAGLVIAGAVFATDSYIISHGTENGEADWMAGFIFIQAIPGAFLLELIGMGSIKTSLPLILAIESLVDGLVASLFVLFCGFCWRFISRAYKNNQISRANIS